MTFKKTAGDEKANQEAVQGKHYFRQRLTLEARTHGVSGEPICV
jgi:hypothetical protein